MSRLSAAVLFSCLLLASAGTAADGASASGEVARRVSSMYIAPMAGTMFYRLYDPAVGTVEFRRVGRGGRFAGPDGWKADLVGETMTVTPPNEPNRLRFRFKNGSPVGFLLGDDEFAVQRRSVPVYPGTIPEMWDVSGEESPLAHKWKGRFAWPYRNPNHDAVLYSFLALAGLCLLCFRRGRMWKAAGAAALCGFGVLVLATGSRGGLVALVLGAALMGISRFAKGGWTRGRLVVVGLLAALFVAAFAAASIVGRASMTLKDAGNDLRTEVWSRAPRMMVDAPGGWASVLPSGRAYINWYQPLEKNDVTYTLISGHLTFMSNHGWLGRFAWVFFWAWLLIALFRFARQGGSPLPLGAWSMFAVADCFNPVHPVCSLWLLPVASLVPWLWTRPWKGWRGECVPMAVAAGLSAAVLAGIYFVGSSVQTGKGPSIRVDGPCVLVNGSRPSRWVVDDGATLCWTLTGKDVRSFYEHMPQSPALGFARRVDDVPKSVDVLVVAGSRCRDYLELRRKGRAPRARKLVFLSPPFGPSEVPPELIARGGFLMVLGEFASRYADVYGKPPFPDWIATVDGAELYIPGWVGLATTL